MAPDDEDGDWQEECLRLMRLIIGVVVEYAQMIDDQSSPAGWALADLRSINRDLLQAMEDANKDLAQSLLNEGKALLTEFVHLAG
jgi:hypothetical protein